MKIAYIISAYRLPSLLVRLVNRLDAPGARICVHVDAKTPESVYTAMVTPLADRRRVHFLPRHDCHWGDFGHVRATLKGLSAIEASGEPYDFVVLLTGQDYPIKSNAAIAAALAAAADRIFLHGWPLPTEHWDDGGTTRYEHWHFRVGTRTLAFPGAPFGSKLLNRLWSVPARLLRLRRAFPPGLRPYGGSSYWMLPADCARYVLAFVRERPDVVRFFEHVHVPDEMFFQTIIMNSHFRQRLADDALRYVDWDAGGNHPKVLTMDDLGALLRSSALFARKFDPAIDAEVLDRLDRAAADEASGDD